MQTIDASGCGKTKACSRMPAGCQDPENDCDYFYTQEADHDTGSIKFELAAKVAGWLAFGYNFNHTMVGAGHVSGTNAGRARGFPVQYSAKPISATVVCARRLCLLPRGDVFSRETWHTLFYSLLASLGQWKKRPPGMCMPWCHWQSVCIANWLHGLCATACFHTWDCMMVRSLAKQLFIFKQRFQRNFAVRFQESRDARVQARRKSLLTCGLCAICGSVRCLRL